MPDSNGTHESCYQRHTNVTRPASHKKYSDPNGMSNQIDQRLSVVIATLGGKTLQDTIETLNQGTVAPMEILVCIPQKEAANVSGLKYHNVRTVVTPCRGQVAQRAYGFGQVHGELVMQLDDDMQLAPDCVAKMKETLVQFGPRCAVAPALVEAESGLSAYRKPDGPGWLQSVYYWMMNGSANYQPGTINKACGAVGVDPLLGMPGQRVYEVEWLPGGCAMHYRSNLIMDNYFPFAGKAYCEDIIHSHYLRKKGIRLLVDVVAECRLELVYSSSINFREYFSGLKGDIRARSYFAKLTGRSRLRMYVFYTVSLASYLAKRVIGWNLKRN